MIEIQLKREFIEVVRRFFQDSNHMTGDLNDHAKSDYWKDHARMITMEFGEGTVRLSGASGYYIPPEVYSLKSLLRQALRLVQLRYKKTCLWLDRKLRLGEAYSPTTLVPAEIAYDLVMSGHELADYAVVNPFMVNPKDLRPIFPTSRDLRRNWFLKSRYLVTTPIFLSAYHHAVFSRYLGNGATTYLEIGAGSGNLAALMRRYNGLRVIVVDLPETMLFSVSMLMNAFPDSTFSLPHEISKGQEFPKVDFVFLLPNQVDLIPDSCVDIAANTDSMQEMTHEQIDEYFELVQRVCKNGGIWCNDNRMEKFPGLKSRPVRSYEFPYRPQNQVLVHEISRLTRLTQVDPSTIRVERIVK